MKLHKRFHTLLSYLLRDEFTGTLAAGSVNNTKTTDNKSTRHIIDTGSHLSLGSGLLTVDATSGSSTDPGIYLNSVARRAGITLLVKAAPTVVNGAAGFGFSITATSRATNGVSIKFEVVGNIWVAQKDGEVLNNTVITYAAGTYYDLAIQVRASGYYFYVRIQNRWLLIHYNQSGTTALLYPASNFVSNPSSIDYFRLADLPLPVPLLSDGFSVSGVSDGLGHPEANGGGGKTWVNWRGTWDVSGGKAQATALHGEGDAVAVVDVGTSSIILTATLTRAAGNIGVVIRGRDDENFIMVYWDGSRVQTYAKLRGGAPSYWAQSAPVAEGAGKLKVSIREEDASCSRLMIHWNEVDLAGTGYQGLLGELQAGTCVGLYTTDLNNTVDNLEVYAMGRDREYQRMDGLTDNNQSWLSAEKYIVFDGNSMIAGSLVTDIPYKVVADLGSPWAGTNVGVGGQGTAAMLLTAAHNVDVHYNASRAENVVVYWEGRNDLTTLTAAEAYANTVAYCQARQAVGWKVVVLTLSICQGDGAPRTDYDDLLIANWATFCDALVRIDQDPEIGDTGDPTDLIYFQAVGSPHLTPAGYAIAAGLVETAIAAL